MLIFRSYSDRKHLFFTFDGYNMSFYLTFLTFGAPESTNEGHIFLNMGLLLHTFHDPATYRSVWAMPSSMSNFNIIWRCVMSIFNNFYFDVFHSFKNNLFHFMYFELYMLLCFQFIHFSYVFFTFDLN